MEGPARVTGQPSARPRKFVGGIVVDDDMDHFSHRNLRLDRIEEADELLMAVTLHVAANDGPSRMLRAANNVVVPGV